MEILHEDASRFPGGVIRYNRSTAYHVEGDVTSRHVAYGSRKPSSYKRKPSPIGLYVLTRKTKTRRTLPSPEDVGKHQVAASRYVHTYSGQRDVVFNESCRLDVGVSRDATEFRKVNATQIWNRCTCERTFTSDCCKAPTLETPSSVNV